MAAPNHQHRTLSSDGPPAMSISFEHCHTVGHSSMAYVRVWGYGAQNWDQPAPVLRVETPSFGVWSLTLNNEDCSGAISPACAREVWNALISKGWVPEDGDPEL